MTDNPKSGLTDDELDAATAAELPQREQMSLIDPSGANPLSTLGAAAHIQPEPPSTLPIEPTE